MIRTALYIRVSTAEQTVVKQERELRPWAERLGLEGVHVYRDTTSGAKAERAQLAELLAAAHRREFAASSLFVEVTVEAATRGLKKRREFGSRAFSKNASNCSFPC